ncbi:MAG: SpoIIE family protein phosphatase [Methylovulum sp.]|nr:SpoIIE family protein phosphatase [Methylovulum sp.]
MDQTDSECRKIESALAESEERFSQMAEMTGEWLWEQDNKGYYSYSSTAVNQILGYRPDEVIGKHYTQFLTAQDQASQQHYANSRQPFYGLTNHYRHKDGHQVLTESTGLPLFSATGKLLKWRGVDRDITAKKAAEQQIHNAQIALAITQSEINIAQKIQISLLPSAPIKNAHFEVTGVCLPAEQIGGDYFDYFFRDENHLDMVIADVSGHSIGPALFMVEARSAIRAQAHRPETASETLNILNNFLYEDLNKTDYFITLFYLQYDIATRQLSIANAGHPPPLLLRSSQARCQRLDADGLILGIRKNIKFEQKTLILAAGDLLLIYTDGLIEAENPEGEFFGVGRVSDAFIQNARYAPQQIIMAILDELKQFCRKTAFNDDITLMVFKTGRVDSPPGNLPHTAS